MKKYLSIIFAALLLVNVLTGCAEQKNLPISTSELGSMPDNSYSNEEYQKLLALQFENYEDMTISDYQRCVGELTDTVEYMELLERFSKSEILYELKDTDETASFLFYVLPLTGDEWKTQNYSEQAISAYSEDNARLEYSFSLTILDADALTIREYNAIRLNVISGMQDILSSQSEEDLQNGASMSATIQNDIDSLIKQLQTEKIGIAIEYAYFPTLTQDIDKRNEQTQGNDKQETRRYSNGTEEDYHSLLSLKTPDYQNMPIADFNSLLLTWENEDRERSERIDEDIKWNDFSVALTAEDLSFVKLTVFLSGMENGKEIQSIYTGTKQYSPYYDKYLPEKTSNGNSNIARCSLYYQFFYSISEKEIVTVGERDRQIEGMINAVQTFWDDMDVERALKMNEEDIVKELEEIAATYCTEHVTITINTEQTHFESMDERAYAN